MGQPSGLTTGTRRQQWLEVTTGPVPESCMGLASPSRGWVEVSLLEFHHHYQETPFPLQNQTKQKKKIPQKPKPRKVTVPVKLVRPLLSRLTNMTLHAINNEPFTEQRYGLFLNSRIRLTSPSVLSTAPSLVFFPCFITDEAVTDSFHFQKLLRTSVICKCQRGVTLQPQLGWRAADILHSREVKLISMKNRSKTSYS